MSQIRIPAVYMRGGTSKGVFFLAKDLPSDPCARDRVLLRVIGSPDPYGKQIDGMGGATSSTSKVVVLSPSTRSDCDVDYCFGAVAIHAPVIDWSGNCGNLTAAVGPFAIRSGLVQAPSDGWAMVRLWQANIQRKIVAHVPMARGQVQETGDFALDGVAFPGAEVQLEFLDLAGGAASEAHAALFPTGRMRDTLDIPGLGRIEATLINAGNPTVFVHAASLGMRGTELQGEVNGRPDLLERAELLRAYGAVAMGLVTHPDAATSTRPHTPKLACIAPPASYLASDGRPVEASSVDLLVRIFSMGLLHHAMTGTGAVAIAAAAAIPGTVIHEVAALGVDGCIRFGHPSGRMRVGAHAAVRDGLWSVTSATMSRSARRLMDGWVYVPEGLTT